MYVCMYYAARQGNKFPAKIQTPSRFASGLPSVRCTLCSVHGWQIKLKKKVLYYPDEIHPPNLKTHLNLYKNKKKQESLSTEQPQGLSVCLPACLAMKRKKERKVERKKQDTNHAQSSRSPYLSYNVTHITTDYQPLIKCVYVLCVLCVSHFIHHPALFTLLQAVVTLYYIR